MTIIFRPVTYYVFFGMGFRVFRFWGHFFIAYLGCENFFATKVSNKKMMQKHEYTKMRAVYNRPKTPFCVVFIEIVYLEVGS